MKGTPMTFTFGRNHQALDITIRCDRCPTWAEIARAVLQEYPHVRLGTIPSEAEIQYRFKEWHRYGAFSILMSYPYGNQHHEKSKRY